MGAHPSQQRMDSRCQKNARIHRAGLRRSCTCRRLPRVRRHPVNIYAYKRVALHVRRGTTHPRTRPLLQAPSRPRLAGRRRPFARLQERQVSQGTQSIWKRGAAHASRKRGRRTVGEDVVGLSYARESPPRVVRRVFVWMELQRQATVPVQAATKLWCNEPHNITPELHSGGHARFLYLHGVGIALQLQRLIKVSRSHFY